MKVLLGLLLSALATNTVLADMSAWKEYQCLLQRVDSRANFSLGICSGTFLNKNIFLTAAHCIDILSAGDVDDSPVEYLIDCPSLPDFVQVKGVAVHPYFFTNNEDLEVFNPAALRSEYVVNSNQFVSFAGYNDIALLYTDTVDFSNFPVLNTSHRGDYKDCSFLGFSDYCSSPSGKGCLRQISTAKTPDFVGDYVQETCNLKDGSGCYLPQTERYRFPYYLQVEAINFNHGDSGSALICKVNNKDTVVGLIVEMDVQTGILATSHKAPFILDFLHLTESEFDEKSKNFKIENRYLQVLKKAAEIKRELHSVKKIKAGRQAIKILSQLAVWIESEKYLINEQLEQRNIKHIYVYPSAPGFLRFLDKPKIERFSETESILFIGTEARVDDVKNLLFP